MSDSLWPHGLQHARLPSPSLSPRICLNSCPLSSWCHPIISFSVTLFSFWFQSSPASESFPMSQLFASSSQSIRGSASASVLPMNIQGWFPFILTGLISLQSMGLSRVFSSTTIWERLFFGTQLPWWLRGYSVCLQCRRPGFEPWVGKIPWRRKWQPTPVFLPGESHGWRSLVGYSPSGHKESDTTEWLDFHFHSLALSLVYGPTLTAIHDSWENHSFDYIDLCQQSDVSAF